MYATQQIAVTRVVAQSIVFGRGFEKRNLQIARGESVFQHGERLLAHTERDVQNGDFARRDVTVQIFYFFENLQCFFAVAGERAAASQMNQPVGGFMIGERFLQRGKRFVVATFRRVHAGAKN